MGAHWEWVDVNHPFAVVEVVPGGVATADGHTTDGPTLVLGGDDIVAVQASSRANLRAYLERCLRAVDDLMCDKLPPIIEIRARDVEIGDEVFEDPNDTDYTPVVVATIHGGDDVMFEDANGNTLYSDGDSPVQVRKGITVTWRDHGIPELAYDEKFDDAEFYEPGELVTVTGRDGYSVTVICDGTRRWDHVDDAEYVSTPEEFRRRFPDGTLPEDGVGGWSIVNNGWFSLNADDTVAYSLKEVLNDAIGRVRHHQGGPSTW